MVYDAWNRLVAVKDASGNTLKSYSYDGQHRRISETAGGVTTDLYYSDAWQVLEERVTSGGTSVPRVQYVWSPVYVDALVLRDRDTNGDGTLDERLWVAQDANYNVTALFDNAGNVVERYVYDPFGQVTVLDASWNTLSASAFGWVYLHQGGRLDATSGLYHFRHRDYSPTLGRWTSLAPIRYAAGDVNLYRTVFNAPTIYTDPSGLDGQPHWFWDCASLGLYPGYRYIREWRRSSTLDDRLAEAGRRTQTDILPPYRPGDGNHSSVHNLSRQYIPGHAASWQTGMEGVTVLATVGVMWTAAGPTWVSPSGQTYVWTNGRWWNSTANRAATAQEAAAANRAVAATRAPATGGRARMFASTTETGSSLLPAGTGRTDKFGNVVYSTLGSAEDVALARYHESVHSFLSPRLNFLREFRADLGMAAYNRSSLVRYLEEALAENYAQLRVHGIRGLPTGIAFPVKGGYVTLRAVVTEGAIATIVVGGTTYGVYYAASK